MNVNIKVIKDILASLQQCKARIVTGMTIGDAINLFDEHGLSCDASRYIYGEHCEWISDKSLPLCNGVWLDLRFEHLWGGDPALRGPFARAAIQTHMHFGVNNTSVYVYIDDNEFHIHCLHRDNEFHIELFDGADIQDITDISRYNWYSCGSNCYQLGEKSLMLLKAIDQDNGVVKDRNGRPIPESCMRYVCMI